GGVSVRSHRTPNSGEVGHDAGEDIEQGRPAGPIAGAAARFRGRHYAWSSAPVAAITSDFRAAVDPSDLLARFRSAFGGDSRFPRDHQRQADRAVLLKNADALVRAKVRLAVGEEQLAFVYADVGATDSALRWQGLAGIRCGHGVDLLGGWRNVTYHFSPGNG